MSDARLRSLARSDDPADRARLLTERLRAGETCLRCEGRSCPQKGELVQLTSKIVPLNATHEVVRIGGCEYVLDFCPACAGLTLSDRIALAAYCGDEAALVVTGGCMTCGGQRWVSPPTTGPKAGRLDYMEGCPACGLGEDALGRWVRGLSRWGRPVPVRAAVAAARVVLRLWECEHGSVIEGWGCTDCQNTGYAWAEGVDAECAIEAAEEWLACPCEQHGPQLPYVPSSIPADEMWWQQLASAIVDHGLCAARCALAVGSAAGLTSSEAEVRQVIQAALIRWALLHG